MPVEHLESTEIQTLSSRCHGITRVLEIKSEVEKFDLKFGRMLPKLWKIEI